MILFARPSYGQPGEAVHDAVDEPGFESVRKVRDGFPHLRTGMPVENVARR